MSGDLGHPPTSAELDAAAKSSNSDVMHGSSITWENAEWHAKSLLLSHLSTLTGRYLGEEVTIVGYSSSGDGGAGRFVYSTLGSDTADGVLVVASAASGFYWKRVYSGPIHATWFGCVGDGTTDDSTAAQAALNAAKGKTLLFPRGKTYYLAGLLLDGSTYNDTHIIFDGELKLKANGGANNFYTNWCGVIIRDCARVKLEIKADGNRSAMTATEHILVVAVAGATDCDVSGVIREVRGDGVLICQKDFSANSTNSNRVRVKNVSVINTADDGRNALSIISCDNLVVDGLHFDKVGGVIGGTRMPGGLDAEPYATYHSIADFTISNVTGSSAGVGGFQLFGIAATNDATRDWVINRGVLSNIKITLTDTGGAVKFFRCRNVKGSVSTYHSGTAALGYDNDYADRLDLTLVCDNCNPGMHLGYSDYIKDSDINVDIQYYGGLGVATFGLTNTRIRGNVKNPSGLIANPVGVYMSNKGTRVGLTQDSVIYSVNVPYSSGLWAGYYNEGATGYAVAFTNSSIRDCELRGWPALAAGSGAAFAGQTAYPTRVNVGGVELSSAPSYGRWIAGETVSNTAPAVAGGAGSQYVVSKWLRITTGTGNVLNTDWVEQRTLTGT